MTSPVLLVRHTAVAKSWHGRCYGASDAGLSVAGAAHARALAVTLARWCPAVVVHSGLRRSRSLAERLAALTGAGCVEDMAWRERDFGTWEGRRWTSIYRETGSAMDGMIDAPALFRPGGGETTTELADRAVAAMHGLPPGRVAVISHGGPIAAIVGTARRLAVRDWLPLVPETGGTIELER